MRAPVEAGDLGSCRPAGPQGRAAKAADLRRRQDRLGAVRAGLALWLLFRKRLWYDGIEDWSGIEDAMIQPTIPRATMITGTVPAMAESARPTTISARNHPWCLRRRGGTTTGVDGADADLRGS
jgi:hypothetical protein